MYVEWPIGYFFVLQALFSMLCGLTIQMIFLWRNDLSLINIINALVSMDHNQKCADDVTGTVKPIRYMFFTFFIVERLTHMHWSCLLFHWSSWKWLIFKFHDLLDILLGVMIITRIDQKTCCTLRFSVTCYFDLALAYETKDFDALVVRSPYLP